jgi:hypothetical protein
MGTWRSLTPRERRIVELRAGSHPVSVTQIAAELQLSAMRIYQIERSIKRRVRAAVPDSVSALTSLSVLVGELGLGANDLGSDAEGATLLDVIAWSMDLTTIAGIAAPADAWEGLRRHISAVGAAGISDVAAARRYIERTVDHVSPSQLAAIVATLRGSVPGVRRQFGKGDREDRHADLVRMAFSDAGIPLSVASLSHATALDMSDVREVLRGPEFGRVGKGVYAPAAWDLPVYRGIEAALYDAVAGRGGIASASEVVAEVVERYGCTAASANVTLYTSARLIRKGDRVEVQGGTGSL